MQWPLTAATLTKRGSRSHVKPSWYVAMARSKASQPEVVRSVRGGVVADLVASEEPGIDAGAEGVSGSPDDHNSDVVADVAPMVASACHVLVASHCAHRGGSTSRSESCRPGRRSAQPSQASAGRHRRSSRWIWRSSPASHPHPESRFPVAGTYIAAAHLSYMTPLITSYGETVAALRPEMGRRPWQELTSPLGRVG